VPTVETAASPAAEAAPAVAELPAGVGAKRTPEEIERLKAEAAARRAAKAAGETPATAPEPAPAPGSEVPPAPVAEAAPAPSVATQSAEAAPTPSGVGAKRTPEEIERLKAEAAARRAAKAGQGGGQ
jgi:uncharacterized small protein (DUF1192 family)